MADYNISPEDVFTFCVWAKSDVTQTSGNYDIIFRWTDSGSGGDIGIYYSGIGANQLWCFGENSAGTARFSQTPTTTLSSGTWYFYIMEVNNVTGRAKLWIDDSNVFDVAMSGTDVEMNNNMNFVLGDRAFGGSEGFDGTIDEMRIYTRQLSDEERTALYNGYDSPTKGCSVGGNNAGFFFV